MQQAFIRLHRGETHHVQRAVVPKEAVIIGYGEIPVEERQVFRRLVERNANNMCFEGFRVVFAEEENLEEIVRNEVQASVLVNCGFLEPEQNDVAVEMVGLFAKRNGYPLGCTLKIGSGEAILSTPFRFLVRAKIRRLARALARGECREMEVTMPLTKGMFLRASSRYWEGLGRCNGITPAQMAVMDIEGQQDTGV